MDRLENNIKKNEYFYALIGGAVGLGLFVIVQSIQKKNTYQQKEEEQNKIIEQLKEQQELKLNLERQKFTKYILDLNIPEDKIDFNKTPNAQIYKICITGGPCAGKTSGMSFLTEKLSMLGYYIYTVPESATLIASGGGMIDMSNYTQEQAIAFQTNLMKTQISLEETFMKIAQLNNQPSIVLCDRGLMDGSAYVSKEQWEKLLQQDYFKKNNLNETSIRDRQYDAVIHLVTAADGAKEYYNKSNAVRHESYKEAIVIDRKLQLAWLGHPRFEIIDNNCTTFEDKLNKLLQKVQMICGIKSNYKTHKKYLIDTKDKLFPQIPEDITVQLFFIEDTFISYDKGNKDYGEYTKVRRRCQKDQYIYIWSKTTMSEGKDKLTLKKMMNYKEYLNQLSRTDEKRHPLQKQRQQFIWEGVQYIIDTQVNVSEGFSTLKVKLQNENQEHKIPPFIKIIRDISTEEGYKTKYLAKKDWYVPSGDEKIINFRKDSTEQ